jgi:hypothetical protein
VTTRTLPHDDYIHAVADALTEAGLRQDQVDVRDDETRGTYCYLDAVITLTPEASGIDPDKWENGLILVWEWHTGLEEGGDERGPSWQWAHLNEDGSNWLPEPLTAEGYASPEYVVESVRALLEHRNQSTPTAVWEHVDDLDLACEAWADEEAK